MDESLYRVFYAGWTLSRFRLSLNVNGGKKLNVPDTTVMWGGSFGILPIPSRNGYTFQGWYTAKTGGKQIKTGDPVSLTGDTILYARWSANTFRITLHVNGGQKLKKSVITRKFGSKYGKLTTPKRKGYTFRGWYTKKTGGTKITVNTVCKKAGNSTFYAHWKRNRTSKSN
jgi:uncharacterized repeat protein (TIGR02543 family)